MRILKLLYPVVALTLCLITAGAPSTLQLLPNTHLDAIPPHVRSLNIREERSGVYICLYRNWGPPCVYHRPSFYPNYPICWTSKGCVDNQHPVAPLISIGSIGPNAGTACFAFFDEDNFSCTPAEKFADNWIMAWYPGIAGDNKSLNYWSVKCVWDDGKLDTANATRKSFRQYAPKPRERALGEV
ncbi:hypothetical protein PMIN06_007336 [Paraphaeosphaeria minitans]